MAGNVIGAQDAQAIIQAVKGEQWDAGQARLTEVLLKLDNYFSLFTYIPTTAQGGVSASVAADYAFADVQGVRIGPWVFINGALSLNKALAAGALTISLPLQLPAYYNASAQAGIGSLTWFISAASNSRHGQAQLRSALTFSGLADNNGSDMGAAAPLATGNIGSTLRFEVQYQTTATPF